MGCAIVDYFALMENTGDDHALVMALLTHFQAGRPPPGRTSRPCAASCLVDTLSPTVNYYVVTKHTNYTLHLDPQRKPK